MMKRSILLCLNALGLMVLFCGTIPTLFAASVWEHRGLDFVDGHVANAPTGKPLFVGKFDSADQWNKPMNYQNALKITFGQEYEGQKCLVVSGKDIPKMDTAWNVASKPVKLTRKGAQFALSFEVCSTAKSLRGAQPGGGSWRSAVLWFNAKNEPCGDYAFTYHIGQGVFNETIVYGDIPSEAVAFSVQFGFDSPNIDQGNEVVFRSVDFSVIDPKCQYTRPGWFVSEVCTGGKVSWTADTPKGTQVNFQFAAADDVNGEPGSWSKFQGPDGTDKSFYTSPFSVEAPFMQYKAFLMPAGAARPVLTSVTVGNRSETGWTQRTDNFPPRVKIVSETPTLNKQTHVVLQITDDSPVLWKTMKITVDGQDATSQFTRVGSRLTLIPTSVWADGLH
ncbi:MAG: hypothetical protein PHQ75_03950, partial [Thermoguttaceae bacterium]|nr:hypothetical protein [Thermoguttaceae bacterium]